MELKDRDLSADTRVILLKPKLDMHREPYLAGFDTDLQHFGEDGQPYGAVTPPIFQSSLFSFDTYEAFMGAMQQNPDAPRYQYSRVTNPTLDAAEQKIARLERSDRCKVFSSGMAAITSALMSVLEPGAHVVAIDTCYGPTRQFLAEYMSRFGITASFIDGRDPATVLDALKPETTAVYLESPASVLFRLQDLEAITKVCREKGITTIFDNSYSTPVFQTPTQWGVDMVVHSATKYLAGHSDLTAGVVCLSEDRYDSFLKREFSLFGAALGPFQAWLLLRGLRTLSIRLKHQEQTGNAIAQWLQDRPEVELVHHAGAPWHPQRALFEKQMRGSSSLLSFRPKWQTQAPIKRFVESLEIFKLGVSWGGFESLVVMIPAEAFPDPEVGWIVRLYLGLEDPKDLTADLDQAFRKAAEVA